MRRRQEILSEPFFQAATVIKFSLESSEDDLKLWCLSESEKFQETVSTLLELMLTWPVTFHEVSSKNDSVIYLSNYMIFD